jgi:alpha 1,3-glucosidase
MPRYDRRLCLQDPLVLTKTQPYYDYFTHSVYRSASGGTHVTVPAPLEKTPVLLRGGAIVPTRERPRRSSTLMRADPFTLRVALSATQTARGELYLDAGDGYAYRAGAFVWRAFEAGPVNGGLRIASADAVRGNPNAAVDEADIAAYDPVANAYAKEAAGIEVERIVVLGLEKKPSSVSIEGGAAVEWVFEPGVAAGAAKEGTASVLTIKRPGVSIAKDWAINVV